MKKILLFLCTTLCIVSHSFAQNGIPQYDWEIIPRCYTSENGEQTSFFSIVEMTIGEEMVILESRLLDGSIFLLPTTGTYSEGYCLTTADNILEKECWEVYDSSQICDYGLGYFATTGDNVLVRATIDEIYSHSYLLPLNYPYEYQTNGTLNSSETLRLRTDLDAYLDSVGEQNRPANNTAWTIYYGTDTEITHNVVTTEYTVNPRPSQSLVSNVPSNCVQGSYTSINYEVYRNTLGEIVIIIDEAGNVIDDLPPSAKKIRCCLLCNIEECQYQNKSKHDLITNEIVTYDADTYFSISLLHIAGSFSYSIDGEIPIFFPEPCNYSLSDGSGVECEYSKSSYTIDASAGQVLVVLKY